MISWTFIFIQPPCVPVGCRQLSQSSIYRTPARLAEARVAENLTRFDTKLLIV
jgi:hypothetical protein